MNARVLVQQYPAEVLTDEVVEKVRADILATMRSQDGNRGIFLLLDRSTGKAMSVSLWASEEALGKSEQAASQLRGHVSDVTQHTPTAEYERYQVLALELDDVALKESANG